MCVLLELFIIIKQKRPLEHCVWHRKGPWCEEFIAMALVGLLSAKLPGLGCCPSWHRPLALGFSHGQGAKSTALCRTFHYHHSFMSKGIYMMDSTGPDELKLQKNLQIIWDEMHRNALMCDITRPWLNMMEWARSVIHLGLKLQCYKQCLFSGLL